jgi:COX assembly protein 1
MHMQTGNRGNPGKEHADENGRYQNQDELDKARAEWFKLAGERKKAREEHQRRLEDARTKHKEWWNLDESGQLQGKRLEAEVGGRREENRVDAQGFTRGGVYGSR